MIRAAFVNKPTNFLLAFTNQKTCYFNPNMLLMRCYNGPSANV
jgi:hypothetical protein